MTIQVLNTAEVEIKLKNDSEFRQFLLDNELTEDTPTTKDTMPHSKMLTLLKANKPFAGAYKLYQKETKINIFIN